MRGTMMDFPLTLQRVFERGTRLFPTAKSLRALDGSLAGAPMRQDPEFRVPGAGKHRRNPNNVLDPRRTWPTRAAMTRRRAACAAGSKAISSHSNRMLTARSSAPRSVPRRNPHC